MATALVSGRGGLRVSAGTATVTDSTLRQNVAVPGKGAGIFVQSGATLTLTSSTLNNNRANEGGGIANFGTLIALDSTSSTNQAVAAAGRGGGALNPGNATLRYVTVASNSVVSTFGVACSAVAQIARGPPGCSRLGRRCPHPRPTRPCPGDLPRHDAGERPVARRLRRQRLTW